MEPLFYDVNLKWEGDRKGIISSPDFPQSIQIATPPPFAGGVDGFWSPEHLLTAAVVSCFMTTFLAIAENSKLDFISFECAAKGKLDQVDISF